jgi:hypothetical protein
LIFLESLIDNRENLEAIKREDDYLNQLYSELDLERASTLEE